MSQPTIPENYNYYRTLVAEINPEALVVNDFDECIIGIAHRSGQPALLVYSIPKIIDCLVARDGMSPREAEEFAGDSIIESWKGVGTPLFLYP